MLQRAMAAEAEASREARAKVMKTDATFYFLRLMARYLKVIAADGEMRASKALREASQIIEQSPAALQLRYLQVSCQLQLMSFRNMPMFYFNYFYSQSA